MILISVQIAPLVAARETLIAALGALEVTKSHIELARRRVPREDRATRDHLDTASIFADSAETVVESISKLLAELQPNPAEVVSCLGASVAVQQVA